jgi:UDPglucose 6-dehydrogenase
VTAEGAVIVTKSTVAVGTGDEVERIVREARPGANIHVASNPEFLREGAAITDFKFPDRIIIGAESEEAKQILRQIYRPLYVNENDLPIMFASRKTAELIKYASNAFLATKITFINEIADLCEATGANVQEVAKGVGLDKRIGSKFLHAGPGYGGSCFPKDTLALIKMGHSANAPQRIVEATVAVNDQRKRSMARKIAAACGGEVRNKTIAILGLTFKPNTDDMRDSPSLAVIPALQDLGARVRAFDPEGMEGAKLHLEDVEFAADPYSCAQGADVLVILTEWEAFRALDLERIKRGLLR